MADIDYLSYGLALIVLSGGVVGFIKAGSMMSLGSGVVFGLLLAYGAMRTSSNRSDFAFLLGTSAVLLALMGWRYYTTGKFMPAGLVSILCLLEVIRLSLRMV